MEILHEEKIDENCYHTIYYCGEDLYEVNTSGHICKGFYKKIDDNKYWVRLDNWYDKKTKRQKGRSNKLYDHMQTWFAYMIREYCEKTYV